MLGNDLSQAVAPNPTTYEDLSFDVSKQFNFSPLLKRKTKYLPKVVNNKAKQEAITTRR